MTENRAEDNNEIKDIKSETDPIKNKTENKVTPDNIQEFLYSKKDHLRYFSEKGYCKLFYGEEINETNANIKKYRNLLSYSFIAENVTEGSNILEINDEQESMILDHFKLRYDCYILSNVKELESKDKNDIISENIKRYKDDKEEYSDKKDNFHFIIWNNSFRNISEKPESMNLALENVFKLLKPGGYILFLLDGINDNDKLLIHNVYFSLFNFESKVINKLSWYVDSKIIQEDINQLRYKKNFSNKDFRISIERVFEKEGYLSSYNLLIRKNPLQLNKVTVSRISDFRSKTPAYVYHHLMKCGGTSVTMALQKWFNLQLDHISVESKKIELNQYLKYKLNLENINSNSCIISHFHFDGTFLHQRYPEVLEPKSEFKIFTFIRDPLAIRASLYYYERKRGGFQNLTLKTYINNSGSNFLAKLFPCDETNYKEVLDRYFFIGITEKMQESIYKLSTLVNGKKITVPVVNTSQKDNQLDELGAKFIEEFMEKNRLGYLIYDYCIEKFNKI